MRLLGVLPSWAAALACWTLVAVLQLPSNAVRRLQSESRDMRVKSMQLPSRTQMLVAVWSRALFRCGRSPSVTHSQLIATHTLMCTNFLQGLSWKPYFASQSVRCSSTATERLAWRQGI